MKKETIIFFIFDLILLYLTNNNKNMENISLIVAVSENNIIGNDNKIPWSLSEDMKYFRKTTSGHTVIMGRKTFESIGKPLPNRTNIIITRNKDFKAEGCIVVNSIMEAVEQVKNQSEAFIIGGSEIYKDSIQFVDKMYITKVKGSFEGDATFEVNLNGWNLISSDERKSDEKNNFDYSFNVYERS